MKFEPIYLNTDLWKSFELPNSNNLEAIDP